MRKTNQLLLPGLAILATLSAFTILRICLISKDGLLPQPPSPTCQPTSCHGFDLQCSFTAPKSCDLMYTSADACRQFASCQLKDGQCLQVNSPQFTQCKNCMDQCNQRANDPVNGMHCQEECINGLVTPPPEEF